MEKLFSSSLSFNRKGGKSPQNNSKIIHVEVEPSIYILHAFLNLSNGILIRKSTRGRQKLSILYGLDVWVFYGPKFF